MSSATKLYKLSLMQKISVVSTPCEVRLPKNRPLHFGEEESRSIGDLLNNGLGLRVCPEP